MKIGIKSYTSDALKNKSNKEEKYHSKFGIKGKLKTINDENFDAKLGDIETVKL